VETSRPGPTGAFGSPPYAGPREVEYPLVPLRSVETNVLVWIQPRLMHPAYELWAGERVVATLRFKDLARRRGLAAGSDGVWTIDDDARVDEVLVVRSGTEPETIFHPGPSVGGLLIVREERQFLWEACDLWQREWVFLDERKHPVLWFEPDMRRLGHSRVRFGPGFLGDPDSPLLAIMGKYLTLGSRARADARSSS